MTALVTSAQRDRGRAGAEQLLECPRSTCERNTSMFTAAEIDIDCVSTPEDTCRNLAPIVERDRHGPPSQCGLLVRVQPLYVKVATNERQGSRLRCSLRESDCTRRSRETPLINQRRACRTKGSVRSRTLIALVKRGPREMGTFLSAPSSTGAATSLRDGT